MPASKPRRTESLLWFVSGAMVDPEGRQTLVPTVFALTFPEHADAPARRAGMLYSHHSGSAARNDSQLLPKGIFSCIIYLNTCLRLQGRVQSLSSGGREGGAALGDLDRFHWKIRETQAQWSKTVATLRKRVAWQGSHTCTAPG